MSTILESINEISFQPMTDKERELIQYLRVLLKDIPDDVFRSLNTLVEEQRGERWSDMQLLIYLNQAMAEINAQPALTSYTLEDFPPAWRACILQGGLIWSLIGEGVLQVGETFSYSDNGISLSIDLSGRYQSLVQTLLAGYQQLKKDIKQAMRPMAASIKSSPAPVRIRSYAPRMWTFR